MDNFKDALIGAILNNIADLKQCQADMYEGSINWLALNEKIKRLERRLDELED